MDQSEYKKLKAFIEPCLSPEELDEFIQKYIGVELPWDTVDEYSTSSPLKCVWSIYYTMLTGEGSIRHVMPVARDSMKTFTAGIIQFLSMVHFRRDGNHIAATLDQANAMIRYIDKHLRIPEIAPYLVSDSVKKKMLVGLPPNDYTSKDDASLIVVTATKKGANSTRSHCLEGKTKVLVRNDDENGILKWKKISMRGIWDGMQKGKSYEVLSVNNKTGAFEFKKVTNSIRTENLERFEIITESGKRVVCTSDHMHAVDFNGEIVYKYTHQLSAGDSILVKGLSLSKTIVKDSILSISPVRAKARSRDRWVYDITVQDNHNFFANQILTHNCITFDEVELTQREILQEAAFIATQTRDGHKRPPMFVYLSSRKTNDGPIQDLIDEGADAHRAKQKRIKLHFWSHVDVMEKCPDTRHLPEKGSFMSYVHTETLETHWSQEDFDMKVSSSQKQEYIQRVAYEGCKKCPAWVTCQGRSVNQKGNSSALKTADAIGAVLESVGSAPAIIAQSLNWKPETTGLVFKTFSRSKHYKSPRDFYEFVTFGEPFNPNGLDEEKLQEVLEEGNWQQIKELTPTKEDIYNAMASYGWDIASGVDWGHDPDPAICLVGGFHKKKGLGCVLHIENALYHANHVWAEYCAENIFNRFPVSYVAPDMADPSSPSYFRKHGITSLSKKPSRIEPGVSFLRGLLWDAKNQLNRFAVLDDSETEGLNEFLVNEFEKYSHARDVVGKVKAGQFEDKFNHGIDAARYMFAPFSKNNEVQIGSKMSLASQTKEQLYQTGMQENDEQALQKMQEINRMREKVETHFKEDFGVKIEDPRKILEKEEKKKTGGKTNIKFSF